MGYLIDSGIFIAVERGLLTLDMVEEKSRGEVMFMSVVTLSELWHGVHRASSEERAARRVDAIRRAVRVAPTLDIDAGVAKRHAEIWAHLAGRGEMVGVNDSWIAATALFHGLTVVTRNAREFHRVPGLIHEVW
jgi:tRNA(fMet)-specific endonuclease VapC